MKRLTVALFFLMAFFSQVHAQKYACVNTEYILNSMPEYSQAMNKINKYIDEWQKELMAKQQEVDELRQQYEQEAYLLPDNLKQRRQDEIKTKETELRTLQHQRFSTGGDLDQKRAELMKPVQDRIYNAIERVAREKSYAFVFDKAASNTILYVGEKYDISNQVLEMLGVKPGQAPSPDDSSTKQSRSGSPAGGGSAKSPTRAEKNK